MVDLHQRLPAEPGRVLNAVGLRLTATAQLGGTGLAVYGNSASVDLGG
jgi:hypothetical protein